VSACHGRKAREATARGRVRCRGMTLVELLVAMTIGLVVLAGMIQVLVASKATYRAQNAQSRMQETGRFVAEVLAWDGRMAGYMGCPSLDRVTPRTVANPAPAPAFDAANAVVGYQAAGALWTPALPADLAAAAAGTDPITFRRGGDCSATLENTMASDISAPAIDVANACGFAAGDLLLVTDCITADVFRATAVTVAGGFANIAHGVASNTSDRFTKAYGAGAQVFLLQERSYYVAPGPGGEPALWHRTDTSAPEMLVEGVEDLQLLFGEDTDDDGGVDRYVAADAAGLDMTRVVSIRASVLVRSTVDGLTEAPLPYTYNGATVTPADTRLRRVFTTTVNLRNRSS